MKLIIDSVRVAAQQIAKQVQKARAASKTSKAPEKPAPKTTQQGKQKPAKDNKSQHEKPKQTEEQTSDANAAKSADKVRQEIKEKGGGAYPVEEVTGLDGSQPNTPAVGTENSDGGGDFNPPREPPRSSYRGKSKGRSL